MERDLYEAPPVGGRSLRDAVEAGGSDVAGDVLRQLVERPLTDGLPDDVAAVLYPEIQGALAMLVEHRRHGINALGGLRGGELVLNVFRL